MAIIITLIVVVNQNLSFFSTEYSLIMSSGSVTAAAPYIMIGTLILFCLLYIFMLKGSGQSKGISAPVLPPMQSTKIESMFSDQIECFINPIQKYKK
jgi:hypothetical protein